MISLLDDGYFVAQACSLQQANPDRWLAHALHCLLGEAPDHSRILALILSAVLAFTTLRLFRIKPSLSALLAIALHPMIAFSFFYASQLSTTLTLLWSVAWTGLWIQWSRQPRSLLWILSGLACSLVPILLRAEAWAYSWSIAACWMAWQFIVREPSLPSPRRALVGFAVGSLPAILRPQWVGFLTSVYQGDAATGSLPSTSDPFSWGAWLLTQSRAIWTYFRNLVIPHLASFHGSWFEQFELNGIGKWGWPLLLVITVASLIVLVIRRHRTHPSHALAALAGLAFLLPTVALSAVPRVDWYHPARQMLGSLLFMILIVSWISNKARPRMLALVALISVSAAFAQATLHYGSEESFRDFESTVTGGRPHPWVSLNQARQRLLEGSIEDALADLEGLSRQLETAGFARDARAGLYWSLAQYYLWLGNESAGKTDSSSKPLRRLLGSTYFPATLACLQDDRVPVESCLTAERVAHLCSYYHNRSIPPLPQIRKMRKNPCS